MKPIIAWSVGTALICSIAHGDIGGTAVTGQVLKKIDKTKLAISLGSAHSVAKGDRAFVYDPDKLIYLGSIVINNIGRTSSVAEITERFDDRDIKAGNGVILLPLGSLIPEVDGVVTAISTKNNSLLEISIGSDDGIRVGNELVVFRAKSYLGRIVIRRVDKNRAVCEVIKGTKRGEFRKGDNVTTRIK